MPRIQQPSNATRASSNNSFPPVTGPGIKPYQLLNILENNSGAITDGGRIVESESRWLKDVLLNPAADGAVRIAVHDLLESSRLGSGNWAADFQDFADGQMNISSDYPIDARRALGSVHADLPQIQTGMDDAALSSLLEDALPLLLDGSNASSRISKGEAAWLLDLATHPNTDIVTNTLIQNTVRASIVANGPWKTAFMDAIQQLSSAPLPPTGPVDSGNVPTSIGRGNILSVKGGTTEAAAPVAQSIPADLQHLMTDPSTLSAAFVSNISNQETSRVQDGSDLFHGTYDIDMNSYIPDDPALAPLREAMASEPIEMDAIGNRYRMDDAGTVGNRILFFGSDHAELKELMHHPDFKGKGRFLKFMTHYENTHWEGSPSNAFNGDGSVINSTHGGVITPTIDENGEQSLGWADWPTNYGRLSSNDPYSAQLAFFSLDNINFGIPYPEELKSSAYETMDAMTALSLGAVPFSSDDADDSNTDYKFNILEFTSIEAMERYTNLLSQPGDEDALEELRAMSQYCMEGAFNTSNYGVAMPVNKWAAENGMMSMEAFENYEKMAKVFKDAGGLEEGNASAGWRALADEGLVTENHLYDLEGTGYIDIPFKLSDPDLRPYTHYNPEGVTANAPGELGNGLVAQPVTLAGLVSAKIELDFPRDHVAATVSAKLAASIEAAGANAPHLIGGAHAVLTGAAQKMAADLMLDIQVPDASNVEAVVEMFGKYVAAMQQMGVVTSDDLQQQIRHGVRHEWMDGPSQAKVDKLIGQYARILGDFSLSRKDLKKQMEVLDSKAEKMQITYGPPADRTGDMMTFVPPQYGAMAFHNAGGSSWPGMRPVADAIGMSFHPDHMGVGGGGGGGTSDVDDYTSLTDVDLNDLPGVSSGGYVELPDERHTDAGSVSVSAADAVAVENLYLQIDGEHSYPQDLIIIVRHESPDGEVTEKKMYLDNDINDAMNLGAFSVPSSEGTWSLSFDDTAGGDEGSLEGWQLAFGE